MNTTEHLNSIVAKCRELLANAEKRTPGEWKAGVTQYSRRRPHFVAPITTNKCDPHVANTYDGPSKAKSVSNNATFIASCAGNAEAGWKSTIAAVEIALTLSSQHEAVGHLLNPPNPAAPFIVALLEAWPEHLLK